MDSGTIANFQLFLTASLRLCVFAFSIVALPLTTNAADSPRQTLDNGRTHLRSGAGPEWDEFKGKTPEGRTLAIRFGATRNEKEGTLFIEQRDVKQDWTVRLNGTNLGKLFLMEAPLVWTLRVPTNILRNGENVLAILPPKENDDIIVGPIQFGPRSLTESLSEATLEINVTESGREIPCRITVTRSDDVLAPMQATFGQTIAVRPGVIYTGNGKASVRLLAGNYIIYASRGPEYSLAKKSIKVRRGARATVSLSITREVPMLGLASCDTHVHTFTFSKHGDATLDERMLTVAGEGLDFPVATDHNLIIDYSACAQSNGLAQYFTPITGCEITTAKGHFNAFPIETGSPVPDFKLEEWPALVQSIRATPGVQFVILNHPTDTHNGFCPFAPTNFNMLTGENRRGAEFSFDGLELVNSGALRTDLMETFRGWFGLLNYGYRITGVGASDSHDVSRFIVGQGRTYIQTSSRDVKEICHSLRAGKALISLGLLTRMTVNGKFGPGDVVTNIGSTINVTIEVLGASWTSADRVELFANGTKIREQRLLPTSLVLKGRMSWSIPRPLHDLYLVAIATGPGVTSPHWAIPRPYQPTSTTWTSRVLGATNPIWLDADTDGRFTPAREYARQIIERVGTDPATFIPVLTNFDEAVAVQVASLCQASGKDVRTPEFTEKLPHAPPHVRSAFASFEKTIQ